MRLLTVLLVATSALADVSVHAPAKGRARPVGYIVPKERAAEFCEQAWRTAEYWTPAQRDVDRLEAALPRYVRAHRQQPDGEHLLKSLPGYARQYVGIIKNGRKLLWVHAYEIRPQDGFRAADVTRPFSVLMDDGACVEWRLLFDPRARKILELACNLTL